ncbi:hypothetical protein F4780DRAFT_607589 [Xylariomycetidae sp. FL0641]|nr:hypothetical protein F4780DRAFT_607589 [Xylariomycetidae sp. FL0641]
MSNAWSVANESVGDPPRRSRLYCPICFKVFHNAAQLEHHQRFGKHYACDECGVRFREADSVRQHKEASHRAQQDLDCPGCQEHFTSAGDWLAHVELHKCPRIFASEIARARDEVLRQIQAVDAHNRDPFGPSRTGDLGPLTAEETCGEIDWENSVWDDSWETEEPVTQPTPRLDQGDNSESLVRPSNEPSCVTRLFFTMDMFPPVVQQPAASQASGFPSVSTQTSGFQPPIPRENKRPDVNDAGFPKLGQPPRAGTSQLGKPSASGNVSTAQQSVNPWAQKKVSSSLSYKAVPPPAELGRKPAPAPAPAPAPSPAPAFPMPRPAAQRITDPNDPRYNVAVFHEPLLDMYKCPHQDCGVKKKSGPALTSHLKSPAHVHACNIKCPSCRKHFHTASAWVQHAEKTSTCLIRDAEFLRQALHQATGGFLDINPQRKLKNNTPEYLIDKDRIARMRNPAAATNSALGLNPAPAPKPAPAEPAPLKQEALESKLERTHIAVGSRHESWDNASGQEWEW